MKIKVRNMTIEQLSAVCRKQECCTDCPLDHACGAYSVGQFDLDAEVDIPDEILSEPVENTVPRKEYSYPGCMCC